MSDIVTSRVFVDGEKGITAAKLNDIVASSVIQPAFYTSKPTAGTADPTDIALILKSGAYAQVPISTLGGSATQSQIWSTRLRSFNAIGNPSFEVDQRNAGNTLTNPAAGAFLCDRWQYSKVGTMAISSQRAPATVLLPGTNFRISQNLLGLLLTTAQASLGAGDTIYLYQTVEGPNLRELINDVHSLSLLVQSSVAGLNFSIGLCDSPATKSLVMLGTIPTANTWTLLQFPNLPSFPSGNFAITPGAIGYLIRIGLSVGTTFMAPAAGTWQAGNFWGAPGMSNWAGSPVNSTFQIGMIQHEPGVCSTLMDKPFTQNYDECLRYYSKSYDYSTAVGVANSIGIKAFMAHTAVASAYGPLSFSKPMAKLPTVTLYDHNSGAANSVMDNGGIHHAGASVANLGSTGFCSINFTTATTAGMPVYFHYAADAGW